ncbi:hypothetical protein [Salisediminibacterium halotolerans]|uniref:hypothetical protein n=2 Tax=Salisediminibacterium halotolerans TaxID=517425 RepID=UPI000F50F48D|nr:hypothetical protein [Salisediminibacterium halotolerans]
MTSLDVILKETDDDASSGFFPRASAEPLRAWPCRVSPVSLSRRRKPGCWVILFFEASVFIKKKPCIHSSDASGKARDEDPDSAASAAEY